MPTSGTSCTHVPSGLPGVRPSAENCSVRNATVFVSPSEPGARPSNSSEASVSVAASSVSALIPVATPGVSSDVAPPVQATAPHRHTTVTIPFISRTADLLSLSVSIDTPARAASN